MKQKLFLILLQALAFCFGMGHACAQTGMETCLYAIDADLNKICLTPDSLPEPVEGMSELLHRLAVEVSIPTVEGMEISGSQTVIRFIVDESGGITAKLVLEKQFYDCDVARQMFSIVESMNWAPGYCNGKPVPSEFILPLRMYVD